MIRRGIWLFFLFLLLPLRAVAGEMPAADAPTRLDGLGAKGYCLIERESGRVLFAGNENERLPMASTTKIMTALLALENCSLEETVTAGKNAYGVTGTSMYLQLGESLPMEQMLQGLMLRSGNDAAVAIAEHVGGTVEGFAGLMNERAAQLGLDAHFVTPNGLDAPGHGASALAMARLAAYALGNDDFRRIVGMQSATVPWEGNEYDRVLTNKNKLLAEYEGATGVKTGYTSKAGRCLVFSAQRDGMELVGAVLNCYTWFDSAQKLLDEGFAHYEMHTALEAGEEVRELPVTGGARGSVQIAAEESLRGPILQHESVEVLYDLPESLRAPVREGQQVGRARLMLKGSGEPLGECALVAAQAVEENTFSTALGRVLRLWNIFAR
ncbi:MAG: D-alanyl-D-alanine carboxypeptidase family protein [Eubacteriales bacterium]|nr:D-alanyl-D-alanine carboxypeptidase family protein [Eubacteriales bacterium]